MWIHEGADHLPGMPIRPGHRWGTEDGLKYTNAYKTKVRNQTPIVGERGINREPPQDQYFKGALFLNTLRSVVDDDKRWFKLIHDYFQHFKYQNIMTEDVVTYFNQQLHTNLTPVFDQYLRHADLPTLELKFDQPGLVSYRWTADETKFDMPVKVGSEDHWGRQCSPPRKWKRSCRRHFPEGKLRRRDETSVLHQRSKKL